MYNRIKKNKIKKYTGERKHHRYHSIQFNTQTNDNYSQKNVIQSPGRMCSITLTNITLKNDYQYTQNEHKI